MNFDSILPITSKEKSNSNFGSAFIIYRNDSDYYLLTCAHVIESVGGIGYVCVGRQEADVYQIDENFGCDISVLRVKNLPDLKSLEVCLSANPGDIVTTSGYRYLKRAKRYMIKKANGSLCEEIGLTKIGEIQRIKVWSIEIENDTLEKGNSGSPVLNADGKVIGILSHRYESGKKGFVIAIESLKLIWPDMPISIFNIDSEEYSDEEMIDSGSIPNTTKSFNRSIAEYLRGPEGLYSQHGIRSYIENSDRFKKDELILEMLLILKSRKRFLQNTWLVTSNKSLYCVLDDNKTSRKNSLIQWKMDLKNFDIDSIKPNAERKNRIDINGHKGWLFSRALFGSQENIIIQVKSMVARAKSEKPMQLEYRENEIMLQLIDEKDGRYLLAYQKSDYAIAFKILQQQGYISERNRRYFLTTSGKQMIRYYLKQLLPENINNLQNSAIPSQREEKRILRALFNESQGRSLSYYRSNSQYSKAIDNLLNSGMIVEKDNTFFLTELGVKVTDFYLQSLLKSDENLLI